MLVLGIRQLFGGPSPNPSITVSKRMPFLPVSFALTFYQRLSPVSEIICSVVPESQNESESCDRNQRLQHFMFLFLWGSIVPRLGLPQVYQPRIPLPYGEIALVSSPL